MGFWFGQQKEGTSRGSEMREERSWGVSSSALPASVLPCKISGGASPFQDCTFLPSTPPAFLGSSSPSCNTLPSPCIFRLRIGGLPLSGLSASSADSPDPANTSVGCPFIKIPPFKLSLILFPPGISVIGCIITTSCLTFRTNRFDIFYPLVELLAV